MSKNAVRFILILIIAVCGACGLSGFDKVEYVREKEYEHGGFTYTGKLVNGKFEGYGELRYSDGSVYKGLFKNGGICE